MIAFDIILLLATSGIAYLIYTGFKKLTEYQLKETKRMDAVIRYLLYGPPKEDQPAETPEDFRIKTSATIKENTPKPKRKRKKVAKKGAE